MAFDISLLPPDITAETGLEVFNPADQSHLTTVRICSADDVTRIIDAAHLARQDWAARPAKARSSVLKAWNDLILANKNALAALITAECGKPLAEAAGEVAYGASFIEWFAEEAKRAYGEVIPHHADGKRLMTFKQPIGVAAAITPWNFPLAMITRKAGPALAAGCPMIVKPAEATPLTALALEKLAHEAGIPKDIFRVVTTNDPGRIGSVFCDHPSVRKLSFTGSTAIGKILLAQCASTVKRVSMELGGNAPFIVFDDADIDAAVEGAMVSKYRNAGQTCVCANRFLVQEGVYDTFVESFAKKVSGLRVGDGATDGTAIGPLINCAGVDKVEQLVGKAIASGAKVRLGGRRHDMGDAFFEPTILTDVTTDMEISHAEIFGPVAPIIKFCDEAEAIRIANDTPYGLAAYFYAEDMARVWRVMEALEYGMVGVNEGIISTEVAPFGGVKESGIGREGARQGLDEYLEVKYALLGGLNR